GRGGRASLRPLPRVGLVRRRGIAGAQGPPAVPRRRHERLLLSRSRFGHHLSRRSRRTALSGKRERGNGKRGCVGLSRFPFLVSRFPTQLNSSQARRAVFLQRSHVSSLASAGKA